MCYKRQCYNQNPNQDDLAPFEKTVNVVVNFEIFSFFKQHKMNERVDNSDHFLTQRTAH